MRRCAFILMIISLMNSLSYGQDIERHFGYGDKKLKVDDLVIDDLAINLLYANRNDKRNNRLTFYTFANKSKLDSLKLDKGNDVQSVQHALIIKNSIYCLISFPQIIVSVNRKSGKIQSSQILPDSIFYSNQSEGLFVGVRGLKLYSFDPLNGNQSILFDFTRFDEFSSLANQDIPISISSIITNDSVILVKVGIVSGDGVTDDPQYYQYNVKTGSIKKVPLSNLEPFVVVPKEKLKGEPDYKKYVFQPDILHTYSDVSDSLFYVRYDYRYEYRSPEKKGMIYKIFYQEPFVITSNYKVIGRSLERNIFSKSTIYSGNKKEWLYVRSETDSGNNVNNPAFFKFKLNFPLENSFYDLYYNNQLNTIYLSYLDKYELILLKNFVYAKYNYRFNKSFMQAYFNTFAFYNNPEQKKKRNINVVNMFTAIDRKNIEAIDYFLLKK